MMNEGLYLKEIEYKELDVLFYYLKQDFPIKEQTPQFILRSAFKREILHGFFLTDGEKYYGYVVYDFLDNSPYVHILYIGILSVYRAKGYGSLCMNLFKEKIQKTNKQIILEAEEPNNAKSDKDLIIRTKRIDFYKKQGFSIVYGQKGFIWGESIVFLTNAQQNISNYGEFFLTSYKRLFGTSLLMWVVKVKKQY